MFNFASISLHCTHTSTATSNDNKKNKNTRRQCHTVTQTQAAALHRYMYRVLCCCFSYLRLATFLNHLFSANNFIFLQLNLHLASTSRSLHPLSICFLASRTLGQCPCHSATVSPSKCVLQTAPIAS